MQTSSKIGYFFQTYLHTLMAHLKTKMLIYKLITNWKLNLLLLKIIFHMGPKRSDKKGQKFSKICKNHQKLLVFFKGI